jgi:hypothetical protein
MITAELGARYEAPAPPGRRRRHRPGQGRADRLRDVPRQRHAASPTPSAPHRRRLRAVPAAAAGRQRAGLRRPADGDGQPAPGLRRRAGGLPGALPPHSGRRVPGHQPGPERDRAAAGPGPRQRLRGGRLRPVRLQVARGRHPQHLGVRAGLPQRHHHRAGAELPLDPDHPQRGQRGHRQQPGPAAQGALHVGDAGDPILRYRAEDERDEASWVSGEILRLRAAETWPGATWPSSTAPTPRAGRWRTPSSSPASPTRWWAGPSSTTAGRSRTSWPTSGCWPIPTTRCRPAASSTCPSGASATPRWPAWPPGPRSTGSRSARPSTGPRRPGSRARRCKGAQQLSKTLAELRPLVATVNPADFVQLVAERSGYLAELVAEHTHEADGRIENIAELGSRGRRVRRRGRFLETVALVADSDEIDGDGTRVSLMTLHTAKGLEFPAVFVVGLEDGIFPHFRSLAEPTELEEERRLFYVGITRARRHLAISHAWVRTIWGRTQHNIPSRFLGPRSPPSWSRTSAWSPPGLEPDLSTERPGRRLVLPGPARRLPARPAGPRASSGAEDLGWWPATRWCTTTGARRRHRYQGGGLAGPGHRRLRVGGQEEPAALGHPAAPGLSAGGLAPSYPGHPYHRLHEASLQGGRGQARARRPRPRGQGHRPGAA